MEIWFHALKITKFNTMHIAKVYFTVKPCLEFQHSQIFEKKYRQAEHCSIKAFSTQWGNGDGSDIRFIIHSSTH